MSGQKRILLIIIITILVISGVIFVYQYLIKSQITSTKSQINSNVQNSNTETASWKTYKNEEYGFEMQTPAHWIIDKTPGNTFEFTTKDLEDAQLKNMENCNPIKADGSCITEFQGSIGKFQHFDRIWI